jgi:rare lipoprotein A (peptidoglycan hydrolase)
LLNSKRNKNAVLAIACALALGTSVTAAQANTGGATAPGSVDPAPAAPASGPSWTVFKKATWYGPGLWGNETACGMVLEPTVIGTAHKGLPCGTQVTFTYEGRSVTATVIDRGPFRKGYAWDLTKKTAKRVGFLDNGAGKIQATVTPGG